MTLVLTTYSGVAPAVQENLRFGIRHGRWGLRREPYEWMKGMTFDWHVIGARASGLRRGPRCQPEEWVTSAVDVYLFRVLSPLTLESSYFWPDETAESELKYPYRFDTELVARAMQVPTAYDNPMPKVISDGIRRAANPKAEAIVVLSDSKWSELVDEIGRRGRRE
ncbi:hypothetical protein GORHZ_110_00140 [Gordonia rhizosphera NBRC 16068]|uniref:Uncharacterized protein n=1 Tax=Gordonia rhizosphera NBRC 16068 TaxID=1108045 RepID=K6WEI8_9ACTN|nr:hypothetical protein GORHZ_110_00140 [Gordonia rhizosphera NBRC 16068]